MSTSTCPWDSLRTSFGLPNLDYCEANLCSWIENPANAWSNLAYIVAGVVLLKQLKSRTFPALFIFLGLCSFFYHASHNFFSQSLDFLGMFLLLSYFSASRSKMAISLSAFQVFGIALLQTAVWMLMTLAMAKANLPYQFLIVLLGGLILIRERKFVKRSTHLRYALFFVVLGEICSILDLSRVWCTPQSLVQGHAVWHLLSALGLYFLALHGERYERGRT